MPEGTEMTRLQTLTTAHLADACLRVAVTARCAPSAIKGVAQTMRCQGSVRPVRHAGSVDVFLEALACASKGDVLVVDNEGRVDEACVGDIIALGAGAFLIALLSAWQFGRFNGGNQPDRP